MQTTARPADAEPIPVPEVADSDFGAFVEAGGELPLPDTRPGTLPNGTRADTAPAWWPFGTLTPEQQRRHRAQVLALRQGRAARFPAHLPEALL